VSATAAASAASIGDARRDLARRLRASGIETGDLDARLLLCHALGLDHTQLVRASERPLGAGESARIEALAARRLAREPVARITGVKEFWGLRLGLSPAVLVPRPQSETVVEQALAAIDRAGPRTRNLRVADLGTGSGAIMLALLSELPNAFAIGTDCDPAALATARANASELGMSARATFVACDFGAALAGEFDLVVANPPYIRTADISTLDADVRDYDPRCALDGGPEGLTAYRVIAADAKRLLAVGAHLVIEIGIGQRDSVSRIFMAAGLGRITHAMDLAGIPRTVSAARDP
jgi:release factor glutamine methyltransferase